MAIVTTDDKHYKAIADKIRSFIGDMKLKPEWMPDALNDVYSAARQQGYDDGMDEGHRVGLEVGYNSGLQDGKQQGKIELLQESKYMNASVSGEIVSALTVSPIEYDITVKVDGDATEVKRYGKNLFKLKDFTDSTNTSQIVVEDGILTITYTSTVGTSTPLGASRLVSNYAGLSLYPVGTYTFMADAIQDQYQTVYPYLEIKFADGTTGKLDGYTPTEVTRPFTPNAIKLPAAINKAAGDVYTTTLQLACGDDCEYEPYVEPTSYPVVDGLATVESLAPSMTLLSDAEGAVLEFQYLRDIDTYIDSLVDGRNTTEYVAEMEE